jgi:hypothetical protein
VLLRTHRTKSDQKREKDARKYFTRVFRGYQKLYGPDSGCTKVIAEHLLRLGVKNEEYKPFL